MDLRQSQVEEFMKGVGQEVPNSPNIPDQDTRKLRVLLIMEELKELAEASGFDLTYELKSTPFAGSPNEKPFVLTNVADAVGDLLYVVYGAAVAYGIDIAPFFEEIQRSNMSKVTNGYKDPNTGKWIKGPGYSPAQLIPIMQEQLSKSQSSSSET